MSGSEGTQESAQREGQSAERLTFFTDAVVAIAMTLLILPLLESIAEAASNDELAGEWIPEHGGQLFSFALSFVIIASFWRGHHSLFEPVRLYTRPLLNLNLLWMLTIVWLPVPTAMVGSMDTDRPQIALYVGSMVATAVLSCAMAWHIRSHPEVIEPGQVASAHAVSVGASMSVLFALALVLGLLFPKVSYMFLFLLVLTGPMEAVLHRRLTAGDAPAAG